MNNEKSYVKTLIIGALREITTAIEEYNSDPHNYKRVTND